MHTEASLMLQYELFCYCGGAQWGITGRSWELICAEIPKSIMGHTWSIMCSGLIKTAPCLRSIIALGFKKKGLKN